MMGQPSDGIEWMSVVWDVASEIEKVCSFMEEKAHGESCIEKDLGKHLESNDCKSTMPYLFPHSPLLRWEAPNEDTRAKDI